MRLRKVSIWWEYSSLGRGSSVSSAPKTPRRFLRRSRAIIAANAVGLAAQLFILNFLHSLVVVLQTSIRLFCGRRSAGEIGGVVCVACSFVVRDLRVGA